MTPGPVRTGVIGVGAMGRPMVDRLLVAGHDVAVFVRRPALATELAAAGARVTSSVAELAADRQVVQLFLYSDEQVREVALDGPLLAAMEPGAVLVVHTTGSPETVEALAAAGLARGIGVVDAPVSGAPAAIRAGTITLLVGGSELDVATCGPLFAAFADPVLHVGPLGAGQRYKLLNNVLFGANIQLALEVSRLGRQWGIDPGDLARTLTHCSGATAVLGLVGALGSPEALLAAAGAFVHKDVLVATEVARRLGAELGLLEAVTAPLLEATAPQA